MFDLATSRLVANSLAATVYSKTTEAGYPIWRAQVEAPPPVRVEDPGYKGPTSFDFDPHVPPAHLPRGWDMRVTHQRPMLLLGPGPFAEECEPRRPSGTTNTQGL